MADPLGQLLCFDEATYRPVDRDLDWADVKAGAHKDCGHPVAIAADAFDGYDLTTQQQIWDEGIHWKFRPSPEATGAVELKSLPRPWAESEALRLINRSTG